MKFNFDGIRHLFSNGQKAKANLHLKREVLVKIHAVLANTHVSDNDGKAFFSKQDAAIIPPLYWPDEKINSVYSQLKTVFKKEA